MTEKVIQFFVPMKKIPTVTHQEKQVSVVKGKPVFYEPAELRNARQLYMDMFGQYTPEQKMPGKVRMTIKYCFPLKGKHGDGEYKDTKPDLDNMTKLVQDCLTKLGFWKDDRYVVSLIAEKFWAQMPGIFIRIEDVG
ncbi:RusA family crossover junction endodeoxyribonuclease [Liquorilactobacillus ghanensis]|nr:RusA family crossover junction endodeoxyribonuclease [Liquorilactobacillus ghanensis]